MITFLLSLEGPCCFLLIRSDRQLDIFGNRGKMYDPMLFDPGEMSIMDRSLKHLGESDFKELIIMGVNDQNTNSNPAL